MDILDRLTELVEDYKQHNGPGDPGYFNVCDLYFRIEDLIDQAKAERDLEKACAEVHKMAECRECVMKGRPQTMEASLTGTFYCMDCGHAMFKHLHDARYHYCRTPGCKNFDIKWKAPKVKLERA